MPEIPDHKKLEFEKLKTEWEHERAVIFNYVIGLITALIFGLKYLVIDLLKYALEGYLMLTVFSPFIIILVLGFIWIIFGEGEIIKDPKLAITIICIVAIIINIIALGIIVGLIAVKWLIYTISYKQIVALLFIIIFNFASSFAILIICKSMKTNKEIKEKMNKIIEEGRNAS